MYPVDGLERIARNLYKIDEQPVSGLSGVAGSLSYKTVTIENNTEILKSHFHNSEQVFGNVTNFMGPDSTVKFTVVGGDAAWGTELHIHDGTVIESGSTTKRFDLNTLYVVSVSAANQISIIEFLAGTADTKRENVVITDATDLFTLAGHGLVDTDKVIISDVVTTTGLNTYTVYYVRDMVGNNFKLSLTSGGTAVVVGGGNGTCSVQKLTQTSLTKKVISMAATNSDSVPFAMICPRTTCNNRIFVRAKSATGQTISIGFLLGLHTYTA
jgi:hypothetical protein